MIHHSSHIKTRRTVALAAKSGCGVPSERDITSGILDQGRLFGWQMTDLSPWLLEIPENLVVDGLITYSVPQSLDEVVQRLHAAVPRSVSISHPYAAPSVAVLDPNYDLAGIRAANYFLERGFTSLAICSYGRDLVGSRLATFRDYLQETGPGCDWLYTLQHEDDPLPKQARFFKEQILARRLPMALFCMNDRLATRVCRWCIELDLAIPEQVAILGVGNNRLACECSPITLSSVDLDQHAIGVEAAKLLQQMMDGKPTPSHPILTPVGEIITRRSTDVMAVDNPTVARALRHIWDHYTENIGLPDIAAAAGVSVRCLTGNFSSAWERSVNEELNRRRILKACMLLASTDAHVVDIAAQSGFRSVQAFNRKFSSVVGLSPRAYRKQENAKRVTEVSREYRAESDIA